MRFDKPDSIDEYIAAGGFKGLDKALRLMNPHEVIDEVLDSGLRGRGGGGFPTGKKWEMAHNKKADQKYLICNADEGDPGAFMDRSILESDPVWINRRNDNRFLCNRCKHCLRLLPCRISPCNKKITKHN
ncbi:MAG: hypothetical protein U5K00_00805 [Melioribacteraceae bacterium]|nr:hypothetical protein [Melioribacteraceae bacterium]